MVAPNIRPEATKIASTLEIEERQVPKKKWTTRKIKVLLSVVYGNLFLGSCYSLMAPIFPAEAERKGASSTAYGFVFGIYQLVMFASSPVYGKFLPRLKPGFMMKIGMLVSGCCVIAFGFLRFAPDGYYFISIALFIRFIDAMGASAFLTASYTTLGCELPDIMGRAMSITETAFALGLAGGPAIGGILYDVGGFSLPFVCVGSLLLAGTVVNFFFYSDDGQEISPQAVKVLELLSDIDFLIDILAISTCFGVIGFNEASLEPHIRQFGLKPTTTGVIFLISGITDAFFSPLWGYFSERVHNAQYLMLLGVILFMICFLIVGPVSFLRFDTNLSVVIASQFLLGLGMASVIVCSFTHGMKHFIEKGYPDEVGTYSMTSGIIFSSACFGAFVGPSLGGLSIDHLGYVKTTEIVVGVIILVTAMCAVRLIYRLFKKTTEKLQQLQSM